MQARFFVARALMLAGLGCCGLPAALAGTALPDHQEFEASLQVPFQASAGRPVLLHFAYPGATAGTPVAWEVALLDRDGQVLRAWGGHTTLQARTATAHLRWDGKDDQRQALPAGYYTMRLRAIALDENNVRRLGSGLPGHALALATSRAPDSIEEQRYDIQVGDVAPARVPTFRALPHHDQTLQAQSVSAG